MIKSELSDHFYGRINTIFKNQKNRDSLIKLVSSYIDKNIEALSKIGPVKKTLFLESDRRPIYDITGLDENSISLIANKIPEIKRGVNTSDPFNILMVLIIRYCHINKCEKELTAAYSYLVLSMLPSIFTKYFKYEPNENIMAFTINAMSLRFKIKRQGTLLATLIDTAKVCDEHYGKSIVRGNDKDIADYISAMKTRLNALFKNIFAEFIKQHAEGRYINYESEVDDGETFRTTDNDALVVSRLTDKVVMDLTVHGGSSFLITKAANFCKVSVNDLRNVVNSLIKTKSNRDDIRKVVTNILFNFLYEGKHHERDVRGTVFVLYSLTTYKQSNISNKNLLEIKEILAKWLEMYSEGYKKSTRLATFNNFRKSLYLFFIFTIQKNAN